MQCSCHDIYFNFIAGRMSLTYLSGQPCLSVIQHILKKTTVKHLPLCNTDFFSPLLKGILAQKILNDLAVQSLFCEFLRAYTTYTMFKSTGSFFLFEILHIFSYRGQVRHKNAPLLFYLESSTALSPHCTTAWMVLCVFDPVFTESRPKKHLVCWFIWPQLFIDFSLFIGSS